MQFSIIALFSLAALASASPHGKSPESRAWTRWGDGNRWLTWTGTGLKARQAATAGPTVQQPAMTDQSGNVVSFDTAKVYKAGEDQAV